MRIALTGTPGTGKSAIARVLAEKVNYNVIEVLDLANKAKAIQGFDRKRKSWTIDIKKLRAESKKLKGNWIIVGHLAHFCSVEKILVLRTRPDILRARLKRKGWPKRKIEENVEAEAIDVILQEAVATKKKVFEFDTTKKKPSQTTGEIIKVLKGKSLAAHRPGKIDWTRFVGKR